jgi:hypothetical protein
VNSTPAYIPAIVAAMPAILMKATAFLAAHLGGRCEPVGDDFANSTIEFGVGRELIPRFD